MGGSFCLAEKTKGEGVTTDVKTVKTWVTSKEDGDRLILMLILTVIVTLAINLY